MNKKSYRPRTRRPIFTRADHECTECFGYPYHEAWCKVNREN